METIRILNEQYEKDQKKANIPVPPIIIIEDYDKHVSNDYVRPQSYLRWKRKFLASMKLVLSSKHTNCLIWVVDILCTWQTPPTRRWMI